MADSPVIPKRPAGCRATRVILDPCLFDEGVKRESYRQNQANKPSYMYAAQGG